MSTGKTNYRPAPAPHMIQPALVEAMLITQKRASDPVYVATLTEELRNIEAKIAAMEEAAETSLSATVTQFGHDGTSGDLPDADWIRAKSCELELRLRRIESTKKAATTRARSPRGTLASC